MRVKRLIANWKMNADFITINKFFSEIKPFETVKLSVAPSHLGLLVANNLAAAKNIEVISQNVALASIGDHTGSISFLELKDYGIYTTFVGHPHVQKDFHEQFFHINAKLKKLLKNQMQAVVFIQESQQDLAKDYSKLHLATQLEQIFAQIDPLWLVNRVSIVYQPTFIEQFGLATSKQFVFDTINILRDHLRTKFGYYVAHNIPLLYGGYFLNEDVEELAKYPHLDGIFLEDERATSAKYIMLIYKHLFNGQNMYYEQFYEQNINISLPTEKERVMQAYQKLDFETYDISDEAYFKQIKLVEEDL